tara:strand:- start:382 stop:918 length:537 start_codon:yes stop_codon:yes gene_type:complete
MGLVWDTDGADLDAAADIATSHATSILAPTGNGYLSTDGSNLAKICVIAKGSSSGSGPATSDFLLTHLAGYSELIHKGSTADGKPDLGMWVPTHICTLKWEIGARNGIENRVPDDDWYFAKNVELIDGDTSIRLITDTGNEGIASVTVDLEGASVFGVAFHDGALSHPDYANALVGKF